MTNQKSKTFQMIFVFLLAFLAGWMFTKSPGTTDVDIWRSWAKNASEYGLVDGFQANHADYPPLASAILLGGYRLFDQMGLTLFEAIKLTILVFLILTTTLFGAWTRDPVLVLIFYASLLLNSVALGYIDIFFAPSLVLALWMLKEKRWGWFSVFYAVSCLTKWQPILIAPFIAVYILGIQHPREWRSIDLKRIVLAVFPGLVIFGLILILYQPLPVWQAFQVSLSHEYLSGNALNFNWIITHFLRVFRPEMFGGLIDSIANLIITTDPSITAIPRGLFYLTYLATLIAFFLREKRFDTLLAFAICGFFAYYTFNPGVHENHLFLVMVLTAALLLIKPSSWRICLALILINNINLFLFYGIDGTIHFPRPAFGADIALLLSITNVAFFLYVFISTLFSKDRSQESQGFAHTESLA
jgi:hypothetical protein